jgi:hypothetical protein
MASASVARAAALAGLGVMVFLGRASMPLLYVIFFAVGSAGLVFENASAAVLPALVGRSGLERANGRLQSATTLARSLVAQPLGAWLFALATWIPFLLDASGLMLVALLAAALPALVNAAPARESRPTLRAAMTEGVRWLLGNRLLRTLALTVAISDVGLGAVFAVSFWRPAAGSGSAPWATASSWPPALSAGSLVACSRTGRSRRLARAGYCAWRWSLRYSPTSALP